MDYRIHFSERVVLGILSQILDPPMLSPESFALTFLVARFPFPVSSPVWRYSISYGGSLPSHGHMVMLTIDRSILTFPDNPASPRSYPIELRESIHSTIATVDENSTMPATRAIAVGGCRK
jgi:hypothetical protein